MYRLSVLAPTDGGKGEGGPSVPSLADYMSDEEEAEMYRAENNIPSARADKVGGLALRARVQFVDLAGSERGMDRSDDSDAQTVTSLSNF